jgi:acetyl-CoA C-acetyltransferase
MTVNRVCGSGAQAILTAAHEIAADDIRIGVAGGMENMDCAPYLMDGGRWGYRMGPAQILDSMLTDGLLDAFSGRALRLANRRSCHAGRTDAGGSGCLRGPVATASAAQAAGLFEAAMSSSRSPVAGRKGKTLFSADETPRPETTAETLAKLKTAFRPEGTITAGNAPGLNSGAAAMVVAEHGFAEASGIEPFARLAGYGVAALEPGLPDV